MTPAPEWVVEPAIVCAYCRKVMADGARPETTSICPPCLDAARASVRELRERMGSAV